MDNPKNQLVDKLKAANYVLVTVRHDPSIDQLAALIGLTLTLNKAGKHAAAVFSGQVPSALEFLKPEDTIEKTTDSLRDFIIALDKSKADKLRYKVEDDVVRIFITPYQTSISQDDLEFSQGDFNVDVVVALGVTNQEDLDEAIVSHGRILHDATVATINISSEGDLGSIHWHDGQASSLSEMMTELAQLLGGNLIDNQIATALLTGIVAETERFSNEKTTAKVMSASALLMAAGANQQLVASELAQPARSVSSDQEPSPAASAPSQEFDETPNESQQPSEESETPVEDEERALEISHDEDKLEEVHFSLPEVSNEGPDPTSNEASAEAEPATEAAASGPESSTFERVSRGSKLITEPPTLGGQLTANSQIAPLEPSTDPLSARVPQGADTLLRREAPAHTAPLEAAPEQVVEPVQEASPPQPPAGPSQSVIGLTPQPPAWVAPQENPLDVPAPPVTDEPAGQTLTELETAAHDIPPAGLDAARDEVMKALNSDAAQPLEPVQALNAQPMFYNLNTAPPPELAVPEPLIPAQPLNELPGAIPVLPLPNVSALAAQPFDPATFGSTNEPTAPLPGTPQVTDPSLAPPVPPPIPFNFGTPPTPPRP